MARKVRSLGGSPYWGRKRSGDPAEVVARLDRGLITSNNYDNAGGKWKRDRWEPDCNVMSFLVLQVGAVGLDPAPSRP